MSLKKSNLYYTLGTRQKRVTNDGVYLNGLAPGQQLRKNDAVVASCWRLVSDLTSSGLEPMNSRADNDVVNHYTPPGLTVSKNLKKKEVSAVSYSNSVIAF